MQSLFLGLLAALAWGLHDFTLRRIGARAEALALLVLVMGLGAVLLIPMAWVSGGWDSMAPRVLWLCAAAGPAYAMAGYGLYRAFAIGPVRLVAPICGAFPLLSVGFAIARGGDVRLLALAGAVAVLAGIGLVARGEDGEATGGRRQAILWSVVACVGFAATFALMQWAAEEGADLPVTLITRLACFATVLALAFALRTPLRPALVLWPPLLLMAALDVGALLAVTAAGGFPHAEFASVTASVFGLVTILLAWRFLGEAMKPVQWLGALTVFAGIATLGLV